MTDPLVDFPQARRVSPDILRRLREIDETACVVHLGGPDWLVGKIRPSAVTEIDGAKMYRFALNALLSGQPLLSGQIRTLRDKLRFGYLVMRHGFRPVASYRIPKGEPDARIVEDFRKSRFLWLHTSDNERFREMDALEEQTKARNEAELTDKHAASDAWQYAFTRSHSLAVNSTPKTLLRSGYKRIASIS